MESTKTLMWKERDESVAAPDDDDDDEFAFTYVQGISKKRRGDGGGEMAGQRIGKRERELGRDSFKCALGERLSTVVVTAIRQLS